MKMKAAIVTMFVVFTDLFLFVTGNPSIASSCLGGSHWVELFIALVVFSVYASRLQKCTKNWRSLAPAFFFLAYFAVLFTAAPLARDYAERTIKNAVVGYIDNPAQSGHRVSLSDGAEYLTQLRASPHVIDSQLFIPTARILVMELSNQSGTKFKVTAAANFGGTFITIRSYREARDGQS